jgi:hypothetical protein
MFLGHHPAAASHYKYKTFRERMASFSATIVKSEMTSTKLFWVESVAPPLHQDQQTIEFKDWRTYHRILLFGHIASEQLQKMKIPIQMVPAFQSTFIFLH